MIESIPPLIIIAFIIVTTIAYCLLVTRIVSCKANGGYQPAAGPRPIPPTTSSGVWRQQ